MISKPIATIDKFNGMSVGSNTLWLDGFSVEDNGERLAENYITVEQNTSSFGDQFLEVNAMSFMNPLTASSNMMNQYILMFTGGNIWIKNAFGGYDGLVNNIMIGSTIDCQRPDIIELTSGNIAYTSAQHLGIGIRGVVDATHTDKIVDQAGRNFTTLGVQTGQKVTNLVTGQQYSITGISTTNSTDDTITFTAEASTNTKHDEFIIFINNKFSLLNNWSSPNQFAGQSSATYWARPIRKWGDQHLILNGNYLAILSTDETTFDKEYKQLPTGFQGLAMEVGKLDDILVSAYDKQGNGYLLYWDGFSDGWNEIIKIGKATKALHPYENGWVYFIEGTLYFTDGRNTQIISSISNKGLRYNVDASGFNAIDSFDDKIFIACRKSTYMPAGVYIFDRNGFTFVKTKKGGNEYSIPYCVYLYNQSNIGSIFGNLFYISIGGYGFLNDIREFSSNTSAKTHNSILLKIDLKQETQIKEVWLNLQSSKTIDTINKEQVAKVSVNMGDGSIPIRSHLGNIKPQSINKININGQYRTGNLGEEIELMGGEYPDNIAGQRFFITNIENKGTATETWDIDPPLLDDNNKNNIEVIGLGVKKGETKEVSIYDLSKPIRFNVNFFGSVLYLEILTQGTSNSFPISISDIQLF